MTKAQKLQAIHETALKQFDTIYSAVQDEREQARQDRRFCFISGAQWEGALGEQFENKPKFEMNKVAMSVTRAMGEARNNPISVTFVSKDGEESSLADACNGLFRADEQDSRANAAYNNAFEEAITGGMGAYRLRTEYADEECEDNDEQRIRFDAIYDADTSVFFDLDAKDMEKADARHCFVLTSMTPDSYEETYGEPATGWDKATMGVNFDWVTPDVVYIAEYYKVEEKKETVRIFKDLLGEEERYTQEDFDAATEDGKDLEADLLALGYQEIKSKTIRRKRVHKYILSGAKVLEDCGYIAGKMIPIIPVYGQRRFIDNIERIQGLVRLAKDAQRLKNMQMSKLAEQSATGSNGIPIVTPEQIAGHENEWADANLKNYAYLTLNTITDQNGSPMSSGPVAYTQAPQVAPAQAALLQLTDMDMKEILGVSQQPEQVASNISGKAVEMIQTRQDVNLLIYFSNNAEGRRRGGEVWLSMAREVYVEKGRVMKSVGTRGETAPVILAKETIVDGATKLENDLTEANFDVSVEVGPTSSSKREATVRNMMDMMPLIQDPDTAAVLQLTALQNMDGEGVSDVQEFARKKLVEKGIGKPTDEEAKAMAETMAQPNAQQEALKAMADQATAEASKARADVVKTIAETEKLKAQTMEIIAGIEQGADANTLDMIAKLRGLMGHNGGPGQGGPMHGGQVG